MVYLLSGLQQSWGSLRSLFCWGTLADFSAFLIALAAAGYIAFSLLKPKEATDGRRSNSLTGLFASFALLSATTLIDVLQKAPANSSRYWVLLGVIAIFGTLYMTSHKQEKLFLWLSRLLAAIKGKSIYSDYDPIDEKVAESLSKINDPEERIMYAAEYKQKKNTE